MAEKIRVAAQRVVNPEILQGATFTSRLSGEVEALVLTLDTYVLGMPDQRIDVEERWPANWWEAFRERWFPRSWLRRWPVRYKSVSIHQTIYKRVCPHVRVPEPGVHLKWMANEF